jgi:hypothetical protein
LQSPKSVSYKEKNVTPDGGAAVTVSMPVTFTAAVALKVSVFVSTSASVEKAFSVAQSVITDYQLAMTQQNVSARVMIQANSRIARPLLANVLAMGRAG